MITEQVQQLISMALAEDVGAGDVTAQCFVPAERQARAEIRAKESGMLAGTEVAEAVFRAVDPDLTTRMLRSDGTPVDRGDVVMTVAGPARAILTAERTALNFLQRLSGIATQTRRYVDAVAGTGTQILDTRKTTPGWRSLEKMAVRAGGGTNHRTGLYDMVMVKDNHLQSAGSLAELQAGINLAKQRKPGVKIEIEADTARQVRDFLTLRGVDVIMLDNMSLEEMRECVALARGSGVKLEASGGVTLERLPEIAATGVDFISSGALTHSVKALDLSLDFEGTALWNAEPLDWQRIAGMVQAALEYEPETGSTNDDARAAAMLGAADGYIVLTDSQRTGRGRRGAAWVSPPRRNLLCSVVLRPSLPVEKWARLTHACALAVCESLESLPGLPAPLIKWPNDIYLSGKKVSGILVESVMDPRGGFATAGVGVNLNLTAEDFPSELRGTATSVWLERGGREVSREDFAIHFLRRLHVQCRRAEEDFPSLLADCESRSFLTGKRVRLLSGSGELEGTAAGLGPEGELRLLHDDGRVELITCADLVRPIN